MFALGLGWCSGVGVSHGSFEFSYIVVLCVSCRFVVGVCLHLAPILKFCMSMCRFGGACAVLIIDIFPAYIFVCC